MADVDDTKTADEDETLVDESQTQDEPDDSKDTGSSETDSQVENQDDRYSIEDWNPDEKRFTQFKGDNPKEYFSKLEDAYAASYNEYKKAKDEQQALKSQLETLKAEKLTATATNQLEDKKVAPKDQSLTDIWVDQEMKRKHKEQYDSFATKHPELADDQDLFDQLDKETGNYMNYVVNTQGRIPDLAESLVWAWNMMNPTDSADSKDEKIAAAVKNSGASSKSKGVNKDPVKSEYTDKQIDFARRQDPSLADKSRTEIETILAKYK